MYRCVACSFVVKTTDQDKRKVFINICGSDKVPMAGGWTDGKVGLALSAKNAVALQALASLQV